MSCPRKRTIRRDDVTPFAHAHGSGATSMSGSHPAGPGQSCAGRGMRGVRGPHRMTTCQPLAHVRRQQDGPITVEGTVSHRHLQILPTNCWPAREQAAQASRLAWNIVRDVQCSS
jgi:hypothetical protein